MEFWRRVHWFLTSRCNENCRFCFKPEFEYTPSKNEVALAKILRDNGVRKVIFTGGEPLLSGSLEAALEILDNTGIDISIHTNATLLNPKKIDSLAARVDEMAIPLDSVDRATQKYLRDSDCLPQIKRVLKQLQDTDVRIGIHTVATSLNVNHMPQIYDFLCTGRFDYWRVYEFNPELVCDRTQNTARFKEIKRLCGKGATASDGGVNCLFADFLLADEQIARHRDRRVQFVGISDYDRAPYFFLDSNGAVYLATWFSQARKPVGNLLSEGFRRVRDKAVKEYSKGPLFDEEAFIETEQAQPLLVRAAWEGNYFTEELEGVAPRYCPKFRHLSRLYLARIKRQRKAPKNAKLTFY
jgi:MoaA/NifB/PqqE/SkfB family radical SAM enzyme